MSEKNLIDQLVSEHKEVKKVDSFFKRFFIWLLVCFICMGAGVALLGLREDWMVLFKSPLLLIQNIFILLSTIFSGAMAIKLTTPGAVKKGKGEILLYVLSVIWIIVLFLIGLIDGHNFDALKKLSLGCIMDITVIGIIPGITLFIFINQGVVLQRKLVGAISMIAALSIGAFGVQYTCHNDDPIHILIWHFVPILLLGGFGVVIGKKLIKKL